MRGPSRESGAHPVEGSAAVDIFALKVSGLGIFAS